MMFRATLRERFLPIGVGWVHDEWITLVVAAFSDLRPIDQPLIHYRIHGSQQVGFQNKLEQRAQGTAPAEKHWGRLAESVKELQQMTDFLSPMVREEKRGVLPAYQQHLQFLSFRYGLPSSRLARLVPILRNLTQYEIHASGFASVVKDLALARSR